ncbi:hypothetical protein [Actinomadura sp. BRA 177]|uniref:hypothetical protein n=1 Tax=Actinomadura sp. BRA 177 TaxID=2745202 RepID=UPI001595A1FA|nr:hypothetical protein [Actinomadura sp. BRA 177]NVI87863.1 hypothetical protein [Actinomadura sp. BRA 177]
MTTNPLAASYQVHARRWLVATVVLYNLAHHLGFALAPLGAVGQTRWADWIDVLTPYTVLLAAAAALHTAGANRRSWTLYLIGAITYTEGHGIHLSANSVYNTAPGPTAHLWDETVGHYLWYAGTALVFAALATAFADTPPPRTPLHLPLSLGVAITWTTNSIEGTTAFMGIGVAAAFTLYGWRTRHRLGRVLLPAFAPAAVMLTAYGIWYRGFPQQSNMGWL